MSRLRYYANTLVSGYALLVVNAVYTLAAVPLAFTYLSKQEYGLWATTTQIVTYLALLDLGMSSSFGRILVDHKDRKDLPEYGSVLLTGLLVRLIQGLLMLGASVLLSYILSSFMKIPSPLQQEFRYLLIAQSAVTALGFSLRSFWNLLLVHQRWDIGNIIQMGTLLSGFGVLWVCFARGFGAYSLVWAAAWVLALETACSFVICRRLQFLPRPGLWGRASWTRFVELFVFGKDVYLLMMGGLLTNSSQLILVTRELGLDAGAVWATCIKPFTLVSQLVYRLSDFSTFSFAEMMVRGERGILRQRFESLICLTASLSVFLGTSFAVCNQSFVSIWTHRLIAWAPTNDLLLAIWLGITALLRAHTSLAMLTKVFGWLRYVFVCEGTCFLLSAFFLMRWGGGIPAMLATSIVCSLLFSFPYGIRRTRQYFGISANQVAFHWCVPAFKFLLWFGGLAIVIYLVSVHLTTWVQLFFRAGLCVGVGGLLFFRFGLDSSLKRELPRRLPVRLQSLLLPLLDH